MLKRVPIIIVSLMVLGGLSVAVVPGISQTNLSTNITTLRFSEPTLQDNGAYLVVGLPEETTTIHEVGKPILPAVTQVFTFPSGTLIKTIDVTFSGIEQQTLSKPILPAQQPVPLNVDVTPSELTFDNTVYESQILYPSEQWSSHIGYGLKGETTVVYLSVSINPIQYSPGSNTLYCAKGADVTITYISPAPQPQRVSENYNMLIIAPEKFSQNLQPLIDHKNSHNVKTLLKTTEEIYTQYTTGRDDQEKIKLCIYDMKNTYNITYVLLVGGHVGQRLKWYIPERVVHNDDGWEAGYASDLYYADVYKYNESSGQYEFEDWDSNHNGIIGEWSTVSTWRDIIDYYPDVYIGRLSCRYASEVDTEVQKIITYENGAADPSWFKKLICVAGDTFVPSINGDSSGVFEGEEECNKTIALMEPLGFTATKLYTGDGTLTGPNDVIKAITAGAGFVQFSGHGNPSTWGTHMPENASFVTGLTVFQIWKLRNKEKLPIVVVGGCHNSQFNVTTLNFILGILHDGLHYFNWSDPENPGHFWRKEWVPECWSEWLIRAPKGGSIATIGCTGLGYGDLGYDDLIHLGGWLDGRFFDAYANQSISVLGQAHSKGIIDYINIIGGVNSNQGDRKTIEEWCLLGDPSLMIGGYS